MSDLMPNEGSYYHPTQPEDQKREENEERAKVQPALKMIDEAIRHFDDRIAYYSSTQCIEVDIDTKPTEFLRMYKACQLTKENLIQEKEWLQGLRDTYKP